MRRRRSCGALTLVATALLSGCAVIPHAFVAVPKNATKPLYQVERLAAVRGSEVRWGFTNDYANATTLLFEFQGESPFREEFDVACVTVNAQTLRRTKSTTKVRGTRRAGAAGTQTGNAAASCTMSGPSFQLPGATTAGPSVCIAVLKVRGDAEAREYNYNICQDGVLKQDPVIVIRTN